MFTFFFTEKKLRKNKKDKPTNKFRNNSKKKKKKKWEKSRYAVSRYAVTPLPVTPLRVLLTTPEGVYLLNIPKNHQKMYKTAQNIG